MAPVDGPPDFYRELGVSRQATDVEVAKAYKKLALRYHPDKNLDGKENAEESFKRVTEAYEVLRDPEKRRTYDVSDAREPLGRAGYDARTPSKEGTGQRSDRGDDVFKAFYSSSKPDPFSVLFSNGKDEDSGLFGSPSGIFGSPFGSGTAGGRHGAFFPTPPSPAPSSTASAGAGAGAGFGGSRGTGPSGYGGLGGGSSSVGSPRGRRRSFAGAWPSYAIAKGAAVCVHSLAKAPEHNGKSGKVVGWDAARERYEVELDDGNILSLRPQHVLQLCEVEVTGLESKPELNGCTGRVESFDEGKGRYVVRLLLRDSKIGLLPGNTILRVGTQVRTQGLSTERFNGQQGQIVDIDRDAQRYTVQCPFGKQIKIKYDNVFC